MQVMLHSPVMALPRAPVPGAQVLETAEQAGTPRLQGAFNSLALTHFMKRWMCSTIQGQ